MERDLAPSQDLNRALNQDLNNHDHDYLNAMDFDNDGWGGPAHGQSHSQNQAMQYSSYQPQQQSHMSQSQNAYSQQHQQYPASQPQFNAAQYNMNPNPLQSQQQQVQYQQAYTTPYASATYPSQQQQQHGRAANAFVATPGFQPGSGDPSLTMSRASYAGMSNNDFLYAAPPSRQANLSPNTLHANPVSHPQLISRAQSNSPFLSQANGVVANNFLPSAQLQNSNRAQTSSPYPQHTTGVSNAFNPQLQPAIRAQPTSSYPGQSGAVASQYNPVPQLQPPSRGLTHSPFQQPVGDGSTYFQGQNVSGQQQYVQGYQTQQPQANPNPGNALQYQIPPSVTAAAAAASSGFKRSFDHSTMSSSTPQVVLPAYVPPKPQPPVEKPSPAPASGLRVTYPHLLSRATESAPFVAVVDMSEPLTPPVPKATSAKRQKKNAAEKVSGEKAPPKKRGRPRKDKTAAASNYKGTGRPAKAATVNKLREDGSIKNSPTASTTTSSSEESSSEDESEDENAMPVTHINTVRSATRPTNPVLAAEWDTIGVIWKDPHSSPSSAVLNDAINKYADIMLDLRAQLKEVSTKIAEVASQPDKAKPLETRRTELHDILYSTVHAAVEHGFDRIVASLGGNPKLVNALVQTLRECLQTNDYGKLPKEILTLMTKFHTVTDALLAKVKFEQIQKRWNKRSDEDAKKYFLTIYANTVEAEERAKKLEGAKKTREAFEEQKKKRAAEIMKISSAGTTKRPHEGDGSNGNPAKKSNVSGMPGPAATKVTIVKKPTGNLLGLMTRPAPKPVPKKRELSPPQESKLGALLASIAQPAEPPKAPSAPPRAPETPEQKARRERKESRRHLRVKFKEGPELEQIRLFKHEQGEDEGRQDDMLRDATDTHNEGMMHKKRVAETIDDEDDYQPPDVEEAQFPEPKGIDFTQLAKATRYGPTFASRGGDLQFTTPEQNTQSHRETMELLVIYTDPNDVPPSAKEAPLNTEAVVQQQQQQQQLPRQIPSPTEPWLAQRLQDLNYYGPVESFRKFSSRHVGQESTESRAQRIAQSFQTPSTNSPSETNREHIQLRLDEIKQTSAMSAKEKFLSLQVLIDSLNGKPFPPTEPPEWMANQAQRDVWIEGHHRDNAEKLNHDAEQKIQQAYHQQAPVMALQYNQPLANMAPQQYQPQPPQAIHDYAGSNSNKSAPPVFDYNAWAAANAMGSRTNETSRPPRREESDTSRPQRENRFQGNSTVRAKNSQQGGDQSTYKYKKELCTYYPQGRCAKGDECTYLHQ